MDDENEYQEVTPIRAGNVQAGDILAANGLTGMPRGCLVLNVVRNEADDTVDIAVLDSPCWMFANGEVREGVLHYDSIDVLGKLVSA